MELALLGFAVPALILAAGCGGRDEYWLDAAPADATVIAETRSPAGTSGKGGATIVLFTSDEPFSQTLAGYDKFFTARDVSTLVKESDYAAYDDADDFCLRLGPWISERTPVLTRIFEQEIQDAMTNSPGSYWVAVPDDCSFAG